MENKSIIAVGMEKISTIRDLIDLWPRRADLASDLSALMAPRCVSAERIHKWAATGSIPAGYHAAVITAAVHRGFGVTAETIVRLHDIQTRGAA